VKPTHRLSDAAAAPRPTQEQYPELKENLTDPTSPGKEQAAIDQDL
jgi:hypothetical protein